MSILTAEYDFDTAIAVKQEEAYASGLSIGLETDREEGISLGMEHGAYEKAMEMAKALLEEGLAPALVARCTGLPLETI